MKNLEAKWKEILNLVPEKRTLNIKFPKNAIFTVSEKECIDALQTAVFGSNKG